jgi:hypothetical protein
MQTEGKLNEEHYDLLNKDISSSDSVDDVN